MSEFRRGEIRNCDFAGAVLSSVKRRHPRTPRDGLVTLHEIQEAGLLNKKEVAEISGAKALDALSIYELSDSARTFARGLSMGHNRKGDHIAEAAEIVRGRAPGSKGSALTLDELRENGFIDDAQAQLWRSQYGDGCLNVWELAEATAQPGFKLSPSAFTASMLKAPRAWDQQPEVGLQSRRSSGRSSYDFPVDAEFTAKSRPASARGPQVGIQALLHLQRQQLQQLHQDLGPGAGGSSLAARFAQAEEKPHSLSEPGTLLQGAWVPGCCVGLDSAQNPQVQVRAGPRRTLVRLELETQAAPEEDVQMFVLGRGKQGVRAGALNHILAKVCRADGRGASSSTAKADDPCACTLQAEFELTAGEVGVVVLARTLATIHGAAPEDTSALDHLAALRFTHIPTERRASTATALMKKILASEAIAAAKEAKESGEEVPQNGEVFDFTLMVQTSLPLVEPPTVMKARLVRDDERGNGADRPSPTATPSRQSSFSSRPDVQPQLSVYSRKAFALPQESLEKKESDLSLDFDSSSEDIERQTSVADRKPARAARREPDEELNAEIYDRIWRVSEDLCWHARVQWDEELGKVVLAANHLGSRMSKRRSIAVKPVGLSPSSLLSARGARRRSQATAGMLSPSGASHEETATQGRTSRTAPCAGNGGGGMAAASESRSVASSVRGSSAAAAPGVIQPPVAPRKNTKSPRVVRIA